MKAILSAALVLTLATVGFAADRKEIKKAAPAAANAQTLELDPTASQVNWIGKKLTGSHNGTLKIKGGKVEIKGTEIVGGTFEVDMTSLKDDDIADPENNKKLVDHLKSDDFFSIEKNPTAKFVIKSVKPATGVANATHTISGDLTIKGKTNTIDFPAQIKQAGGKFEGVANVSVDRTKWDIKYRSGKFFPDIGDKVISDNFTLDLKLVTK